MLKTISSRKKATKWHILVLYGSLVLNLINGLILVPLYLRFIDIGLYGAWLATGNILAWLSMMDPGTGEVLEQQIAQNFGGNKAKKIENIISSGLLVSIIFSTAILGICLSVSGFLPNILRLSLEIDSQTLIKAFIIASLGIFFSLLNFSVGGINRGFLQTKAAGLIPIISNILGTTVNIILLFNNFGILSLAVGRMLTSLLSLLGNSTFLVIFAYKRKIRLMFNLGFFKSYYKIFGFTFFSKLSFGIAENLDLIIISRFFSPEVVTMFELTRRPIRLIQGFYNRISLSLMPAMAHLKGAKEIQTFKNYFLNTTGLILLINIFVISGHIFFNKGLVTVWVGKDFYIGDKINLLLCLSFFFKSFFYNISNFTFSYGNIKWNSIINVIKSLGLISLLLILGKIFGLIGITIALNIAILFTEGIYYPRKVVAIFQLKKKDLSQILNLFIKGVSIATILFFMIRNFDILKVSQLILLTSLYSLLFWGLNFVLSSRYFLEVFTFFKNAVKKI